MKISDIITKIFAFIGVFFIATLLLFLVFETDLVKKQTNVPAKMVFRFFNLHFPNAESQPIICQNSEMDLKKSADCLHRELVTFFNYNGTNILKTMSETELREIGGVCSHYSRWYIEKAEDLGFHGDYIVLHSIGHAIAILSHEENTTNTSVYCLVDQNFAPVCHRVG